MNLPAVSLAFTLFAAVLILLGFAVGRWLSSTEKTDPLAISLNSKCPACGHYGCKLQFVDPTMIEVGDKRQLKRTEPMVKRICVTCGAEAYEKPVLDAKEWIA